MNRIALICGCVLLLATQASALDIAWVSFHGNSDDGSVPSAAAATAGFTQAPDRAYTDALIAAGHTINRVNVPPATPDVALTPALLAELNAADLVIVGRSVNSGSFQQAAETMSWNNQVTVPLIVTSGFLTRASRLGWTSGETTVDITGNNSFQAVSAAHPVFQGITLDGNNVSGAALQLVQIPFAPNTVQLGTSFNTDALMPGGTVIATIPASSATPAALANVPAIVEWPAGTVVTNNPGETLGGKRMMFFTGSRETGGLTGEGAGIMDLTPVGVEIFINAVEYFATPIVLGDVDGNGQVQMADFNLIRDNFRKSPRIRTQGDLTGDGVVNFADFREWKLAFTGSGGSIEGLNFGFLTAVPEPATGLLVALGAMMLAAVGGRRGR